MIYRKTYETRSLLATIACAPKLPSVNRAKNRKRQNEGSTDANYEKMKKTKHSIVKNDIS